MLDSSFSIHYEGSTFRHSLHIESWKVFVENVVPASHVLVKVGQQLEWELLLFFELVQSEHRIDRDSENKRIELFVLLHVIADSA